MRGAKIRGRSHRPPKASPIRNAAALPSCYAATRIAATSTSSSQTCSAASFSRKKL